jgi:hypothetical protein
MKKYLLFIAVFALLFSANSAKAQIVAVADDDMETWNPDPLVASAKDPNSGSLNTDGWQCLNIFNYFLLGSSPISTFEENSIVHSGSHSCKLTSVVLTATSYSHVSSLFKHDTVGVVFTGQITNTPSIIPGVPYASRTPSVSFWYQYFPQQNNGKNDTATCGVVLSKNHVQIGGGYITMNAAASWTQGTVNVNYTMAGNPDTILVIFSSSSQFKPAPASILYIDGVTAAAPLAVNEVSGTTSVDVYPNPASSEINFRVTGQNAHSIKVYDITGKEVNTYSVKDNALTVNASAFASGLYIYKAYDVNGALLKVGKFSVSR